MIDYGEFGYQSQEHASIRYVPAQEVTWINFLGYPALRHTPSGKVRSLATIPRHLYDYQYFAENSDNAQAQARKQLNYRAYKETNYLRSSAACEDTI